MTKAQIEGDERAEQATLALDGRVRVTVYRWAGSWGPFTIKVPCGECALTADVIRDTLANELAGIPVDLETRDWLSQWWKPLLRGGWHAPIVMVEGTVISQGRALNRGVLTQAVVEWHARKNELAGTHLFGKAGCKHCTRGKRYLDEASLPFAYHDVVRNPRALYEMLQRIKPLIGPRTPVTVPQIWIDGRWVGGADALEKILSREVEPCQMRGRCSLSPGRQSTLAGGGRRAPSQGW